MKSMGCAIALVLSTSTFIAAPPPATAKTVEIKTDRDRTIILGEDGDLLAQLIALDAQGIADMRTDFADARREIDDSIAEIEDARAELRGVPGGRLIIRVAFASAANAASEAAGAAMDEAFDEVDRAEMGLRDAEVSAAERVETQGAIDTLRRELSQLEASLGRLLDALRGAAK